MVRSAHPVSTRPWRCAGAGLLLVCLSACAGADTGPGAEQQAFSFAHVPQALEASVFHSLTLVAAPQVLPPPAADNAAERYFNVERQAATCESPASGQLTRAACPQSAPEVTACDLEGLECRYADVDGCVVVHECVYGLWTGLDRECPGKTETPTVLAGSGTCPEGIPVPDSPCTDDDLSCGYEPCSLGNVLHREATCSCGRWTFTHNECPRD